VSSPSRASPQYLHRTRKQTSSVPRTHRQQELTISRQPSGCTTPQRPEQVHRTCRSRPASPAPGSRSVRTPHQHPVIGMHERAFSARDRDASFSLSHKRIPAKTISTQAPAGFA